MTDDEVAAIGARAEAATAGPWAWKLHGDPRLESVTSGLPCVMAFRRRGMNGAEPVFWKRDPAKHPAWHGEFQPAREMSASNINADASFIARARTDVPALVAEVQRLRALVAALVLEPS